MTSRVIAIGDIHGCVHALDAVLHGIQPQHNDLLIVLGDFIDQGRDTRDVIDRLIDLRSECHLVCLLGNHEEMMLAALNSESARLYWESFGSFRSADPVTVPTGVASFPREILRSPRRWCEAGYNITHWTDMPRGGHFAAFEQPELFVEDVRTFFATIR